MEFATLYAVLATSSLYSNPNTMEASGSQTHQLPARPYRLDWAALYAAAHSAELYGTQAHHPRHSASRRIISLIDLAKMVNARPAQGDIIGEPQPITLFPFVLTFASHNLSSLIRTPLIPQQRNNNTTPSHNFSLLLQTLSPPPLLFFIACIIACNGGQHPPRPSSFGRQHLHPLTRSRFALGLSRRDEHH